MTKKKKGDLIAPEQDLAFIRRIMEESRQEAGEQGMHFLIWGALAPLGLVVTYLHSTGALQLDPTWTWLTILAVGWAASLGVGVVDERRERTRTLGRRLLTALWISMAVSLTLIALAGMFGHVIEVAALPGLLSVIIAGSVLLTALLTDEQWLAWVAGGWWLGGALMLFVPGLNALLVMAAMGVALMLLPGLVLYRRARRTAAHSRPAPDAG